MNNNDEQMGTALREEERQLDARVTARIAAARRRALAHPVQPWLQHWMAPMAGAAVLAGVLGVGVLLPGQLAEPEQTATVRAVENPEFYQDLEFYLWLADAGVGDHG